LFGHDWYTTRVNGFQLPVERLCHRCRIYEHKEVIAFMKMGGWEPGIRLKKKGGDDEKGI
jgi:hypothetical protein